ncbi:MAG: hypothetical protein J6U68_00350 [Clostridia bacterium]|nr:hypothetical protein [Clostridia bacterium]
MKRILLRAISLILVVITLGFCLVGCKNDEENESDSGAWTNDFSDVVLGLGDSSDSETADTKKEDATTKPTEKQTEPTPGKSTTTANLIKTEYNLKQKSSLFKLVGRTKFTSEGIYFDQSAAAIEFQGYMTGDVLLTASSEGDTFYTVYVDGKRTSPTSIGSERDKYKVTGGMSKETTIKLASFEGKYFHHIRVIKQSEPSQSYSTLKKLTITGKLEGTPANKKYYIEFYGDSLTAGYSNIADGSKSAPHAAKWQDATQTYAFMAAEELGADCSILAKSGTGLARGYTDDYNNNLWNYFSKYSYRRGSEAFNFSGVRKPNLVVIHLGANDYANGASKDKFVSKGKELVDKIKNGYGAIPIIWAYDPGEKVSTAWMEEIVNYYKNTHKGQTAMISLEWRSKGKVNGHPNVAGHKKNCSELVALIKEKGFLK